MLSKFSSSFDLMDRFKKVDDLRTFDFSPIPNVTCGGQVGGNFSLTPTFRPLFTHEIEEVLLRHPALLECSVVGRPHADWGEEVKACVVAKPGMEVDEADVIAWARERIAAFKAPKSVDVIPVMPRNASGKILRRELRAPYWEGQERQVS